MSGSVVRDAGLGHLPKPDGQAKADLRKADTGWRRQVGAAVAIAAAGLRLSLKEFAAEVDRDERQCARWFEGVERPHFDAIFASARLRQPMLVALAQLAGAGVEVTTQITMRRSA